MRRLVLLVLLVLLALPALGFDNPLTPADLDGATFAQWLDGAETPLAVKDGPRHVVYTRNAGIEWDGVKYGEGKTLGPRHLRLGFTKALAVGSVLTRGGGALSVLKADAAYPGRLDDDRQWLPATRLAGRDVKASEAGDEEYALWQLPPGTVTRALRCSHQPSPLDRTYHGWLGGVVLLSERLANIAPQSVALTVYNADKAAKIVDLSNNGTWGAWESVRPADQPVISADSPEPVTLVWPQPVTLRGLNALWAGLAACDAQVWIGPADRHPREGTDADWQTVGHWTRLDSQYPRQLGPNWLDFGRDYTTRAVRLRITQVTGEGHPHLRGNTKGGRRTWLGELQALAPLGDAAVQTVVLPPAAQLDLGHPPIAVRFTLAKAGLVSLVVEDEQGFRVRNLVSQTPFPAGDNVVWWDGTNDLGRNPASAAHGIYDIPAQFVAPGRYHVRGLWHQPLELRYEFSVYNAGQPVWETADNTGCWLTNHTPPQSALFLPEDRSPTGKAMVYLGSYVSEGGHGLAWVDLEGRKQGGRGWVGGNWTAAPFLARDAGDDRDANTWLYVGSHFEDELRLTALTKQGDKAVVKYKFAGGKSQALLTGIAVRNGLLAASLPKLEQVLLVNAKGGKVLGSVPLKDGRGLAFLPDGRLLALSGKSLLALTLDLTGEPKAGLSTVLDGLDDPQHVTTDASGNLYVSDWGTSHQVKVFTSAGRLVRTIGHAGAPTAGPYDPLHLNHPAGPTIDNLNRLWVAEQDYQPKRVSVWSLDGQLLKTFYGPGQYGGGGKLDPRDKSRFYYNGMEFALDWTTGTDKLTNVLFRPGPGDLQMPGGYSDGGPEFPIYTHDRQYFSNCYNSNPTNGCSLAFVFVLEHGIAKPCAAYGRANDWPLLKEAAFKPRWPAGLNLAGDYWRNQAICLWCDLNDDRLVQPDEVTIIKGSCGGVTFDDDLAAVVSRVDEQARRYAVQRFTAGGAPVYALEQSTALAEAVQGPTSSGGDQALTTADGWTVLTVAPKPFAPQSLCGIYRGAPRWSYPSLWPGLHASHESPAPDRPGELIGTTRLLGGFITPRGSDAGPLWCVNGNQGNMYLFTADGLFVEQLFQDVRQGKLWSMPTAQRNMLLNDLTLHDENFWPSLTQAADGQVYLVDGGRSSLVRVDGLSSLKRLTAADLNISADDLKQAQAWVLDAESKRQAATGSNSLVVALKAEAPKVDGQLDDWTGAQWASVDKRGVAAYFNSNSKPYDVQAALAIASDRLYAAFRTGDADLLRNSGEVPNAPFKTGGALDLMLGTDPTANPKRSACAPGDLRLLVTRVKNKPLALLYRAVVPGTKELVAFSSPWRTITLDQVLDVSAELQLAANKTGDYEFSLPLATLGLKPAAGQVLRGDLGILRGSGFSTLQRVYWSNKATGIVSDVPSEAMLTPGLWGRLECR